MNCKGIDHEIIQKFIDNELAVEEKSLLETHLSHCESCMARVEAQRQLAFHVQDAFNALADDTIKIPVFVGRSKTQPKYRKVLKMLIYSL